jgi:hypothetical protein
MHLDPYDVLAVPSKTSRKDLATCLAYAQQYVYILDIFVVSEANCQLQCLPRRPISTPAPNYPQGIARVHSVLPTAAVFKSVTRWLIFCCIEMSEPQCGSILKNRFSVHRSM